LYITIKFGAFYLFLILEVNLFDKQHIKQLTLCYC